MSRSKPMTLEQVRVKAASFRAVPTRISQYLLLLKGEAKRAEPDPEIVAELAEIEREGARQRLNRWQHDRNRSATGRTAVGGALERSPTGAQYVQEAFADMSWEKIEQRLQQTVAQRKTLDGKATELRRLLALRDKAPDADTPAEAAEQLQIDLDAYLAGAA